MSGVGVSGLLANLPNTVTPYPVVNDATLLGGFRTVLDLTARDAIPANFRKAAMVVSLSTGSSFQLVGGIANANWVPFGGNQIAAVAAVVTTNFALNGALTSDGYAFQNGDRALAAFQADATQNGIYDVNTGGAWTRSSDQNAAAQFRAGVFFKVNNGTNFGGALACLLTSQQPTPIVVGTTPLNYGISSPPPVPVTNDGNAVVPSGGVLTYVSSPSHTESRIAQNANLAAITLLTGPTPDLYGLDTYIEYTAGTGTVLVTFNYTDRTGAVTQATTAVAGVGHLSARFAAWVASGNVTFTTTVVGTVTYNVTSRAARLLSTG